MGSGRSGWGRLEGILPRTAPVLGSIARFRSSSSRVKKKKPYIISSKDWSPLPTVRLGSGLNGLNLELSKWAWTSNLVPRGKDLVPGCQR